MLILSLLFLLLSNAVTIRRDKSILFNRIAILVLVITSVLGLASLFFNCLNKGIGLHGGLFHSSSITQIFQIFIYIVSAIIKLTTFYLIKVIIARNSIIVSTFFKRFLYNKTRIIDKLGKQFKIIEYPLILFIFFIPKQWLSMANILALILFNP